MKRPIQSIASSSAKKSMDIEDIMKTHIERITEMRKDENAPVDTMGCHKLADPLASPETFRFQVLVSLMLSSQTKDQVNAAAMTKLKEHGCDVDSIIEIETSELEKLLYPVSFYKRKTIYLKNAAKVLKEKYNRDVPDTVEGLCSLPGVGPKMAHLVMQIAWGKVEGIGVDTHVHRISNRLGWMRTKTPEETREQLQKLLPREQWESINPLLVGFGQTICLPNRPKCDICLCNSCCPSAKLIKAVTSKESQSSELNEEKSTN